MARVLEYQRCKTEPGIEKSTSIKNQDIAEGTSGIIDQTLPSNGFSISYTVELASSSSKDMLWITVSEFGEESPFSHSYSTPLDPSLDKESMITMPMITSTSLTEQLVMRE